MNAHTNRNRWIGLAPLALALALLGILLVLLPARAQGSMRYVAKTGNDNGGANTCLNEALPCLTIAQAIEQSSAGDTIRIAAGTYAENLTVDRALIFDGAGASDTFVDGGGTDRVFTMTANVSLSGLTIQNGAAPNYGGAIRSNSALTLANVTVFSNTAQIGGGLYVEGATAYATSLVITGAQFLSNTASNGPGGGMMFYGRLTIADSRFDGNHAEWGRGGGFYATGPITLTSVAFTNNSVAQSDASGGALYAGPGPSTGIIAAMTHVTVTGNSAVEGAGGIGLGNFGNVVILGGHFEGNRCTANNCNGGALVLSERPATIAATQFISNEAGYQGGGMWTSGPFTLTQGLFERNILRQSGGMGGGLAAAGTSVTALVSDTQFLSNTAGTGGGVRFFGPAQLIGGTFAGNTGGAVYAARSLAITPTLPYTYSGNFTLESSLTASGDLTFTAGTVTFWNSGDTHYLTNTANTAFDRLNVAAQSGTSVLDVGVSPVVVSGVFTNAGVIHRLAPTQTVTLDETFVYTDGVGQPTALLRQTGGAAMGDTSVRVSANLWTNDTTCNGTRISPSTVRRYFDINSGENDSNVIADLTLRYYAPTSPFYTEASETTADEVVIYHCDGTRWVALNGNYTRGIEGDYRWVKLSGYTFTSFSPFVLGDPPSTDANLSDLTLNNGTLIPTFNWATVSYTAGVPNNITSVRATPTVSDTGKATVQVNGMTVSSGAQSSPIPLIVGANVITTLVTAQDGATTKTYTVTITRDPSSNAELAGLALSSGPLTPAFNPATTSYTATAPYTPAVINVTATTGEPNATIAVNGSPTISGTAAPVTLVVGANQITVTVTAQDGVTAIDYVITVTRNAPAADAQLSGLAMTPGLLTPAFLSTTTNYTAEIDNLAIGVTVTPTASDANASLIVNGAPHVSGQPYTFSPLVVGQNVVSTTIIAEDGVTQQTYVVTVTRVGADGDWYVDPVGADSNNCRAPGLGYACRTIIGAMNKAGSGDRIFVASATYTESLVVTKSLLFIGTDNPVVNGGGTNRVFSVTAGVNVTLDGLTVTGGRLTGATPATGAGAGIYNSGALTLTRTVVTNNVATSAFAGTGGGGIYNAAPGMLRLFESSVISNSGFYGGGLHVAGGTATLDHSMVLSNAVAGTQALGAGIYINGASTVVTATNASTIVGNRNVVVSNSNNNGGGVYVAAGGLKVISSTIAGNLAGSSGGGVVVYPGASVELVASTVFSNASGTASNHNGGGIYSLGAVTLTDSTVASNRAGGRGAGIYQFGNGLAIVRSTIASNATGGATDGGGVYVDASAATQATISDTVVASNTANSGAGVYAVSFVTLTMTGGSIYNNTSNAAGGGMDAEGALALTDVTVYGNRADGGRGGGVYAGGAATLTGGTIRQNTSARGGGGLYAAHTVSLTNVDVLSNTTTNDGPSNIGYGGGLYAAGRATLTGGRFQNNHCTHESCTGGGLYAAGQLAATDTQFLLNRGGSGGGGGLSLAGVTTLSGVQIISNTVTPDSFGNGGSGGGVNATAALTLTNAIVLSNTSSSDGAGVRVDGATNISGGSYQGNRCTAVFCSGGALSISTGPLTLRNATITNNRAGANGGGVSVFGPATVVDTTLADNTAGGSQGGGMNVVGATSSLVMTNVQVLRNTTPDYGGGVYASYTAAITGGRFQANACTANGCTGGGLYATRQANVNGVRFSGNTATGAGGALYLERGAQQIVNTLLDGNTAPQGAGIYDAYGGTKILFTTVASPTVGAGSAIDLAAGTATITDTIVASYTTGIAAGGTGVLQGDYNLFYNAPTTLVTGTHSLTGDPLFLDAAGGNFRLLANSPAVGAGVDVSVTTDIDGAPRPQGSGYDLGAFQVNLDWFVDPAGSDANSCVLPTSPCQTIGGALAKAQIDSTIFITTGVYAENLTVSVPIHFVGTGADAAAVVVDGGGSGRVFHVTASDVTFSGLTIQNGAANSGAGVRATGNLSMTNVAVLTNTATQDGGGIFASSALTLTSVEVRGNTANLASGNGGGIYASTAPSLTNVSILDNRAQIGGGLFTLADSTLTGGLYQRNQATTAGGGIYAAGALTLMTANVLENAAQFGGGLYAIGFVTITEATVAGNTATENGGGVYASIGAAVSGALFQANTAANTAAADEGGGGGLYALAPVTLVDAQFISNTMSGQGGGGGVYISATLSLTNVQFLSNTVALTSTTGGGGAYAVGDLLVAGGLFQGNACAGDSCQGGALFTSGALTMTDASVVDNRAAGAGGGVAATGDISVSGGVIEGNDSVANTGGGVASTAGALMLTSVEVLSNTALSDGGGAYALLGDAIVTGSRFQGNACTEANCAGGGLSASGTLVLSDTRFIDNQARTAGGGASAAEVTLRAGIFQENRCTEALCQGGGLAATGALAMTGTQFIGNIGGVGGGLSVISTDAARIVNSLFVRNTATNEDGAGFFLDASGGGEVLYTTVASPTVGGGSAIYVAAGAVDVTNTIVASYTAGIENVGGTVNSDYNLFYQAPTSEIIGSNSITDVNPLFFDMAADNFRLASASPAIGAATDIGVDTDLDGTARPQLAGYDIGAFEYNACGVTNINDDGPGSLRANLAACPEVVFNAGFFASPRTIQLLSPLAVNTDVIVDGARYNVYTPTIQAGAGFRVFTVTAGVDATLNRLIITGGRLNGSTESTGAGAGVFNSGNLTMTGSVVTANVASHPTAGRGAGIYNATGGVLVLARTSLLSNTAAAGGGLYLTHSAATLDNAVVTSNLVTYTVGGAQGGGVYLAGGVLTMTNGSVITGNLAYTATLGSTSQGGGIYAVQVGSLRLISGTVANNSANLGGGIYLADAGDLDLAGMTIAGNRAYLDLNATAGNGNGGGIYATGALALTGGVLRDNVARISGGGLYATDLLTVTSAQFISNTAQGKNPADLGSPYGGGGIYAEMTATVTSALFQGNHAEKAGGGLRSRQAVSLTDSDFYSNTAAGESGAANIGGAGVITGADFIGNRAVGYGALQVAGNAELVNSLFQENAATSAAGAARIAGTALVTNTHFISNTAGSSGGALQLDSVGWLTATQFISNTSGATGGALHTSDALEINNSHFERNQANGSQGRGGAVFVQARTLVTVTASTFLTNTATELGGAAGDSGSDWSISASRFQGNAGGFAGAIGIDSGGSVAITGSDFVGNRTTNSGNGNGGAIFVYGPAQVRDSLFDGNIALVLAGALHTRGSTQITGTTFSANRAGSGGAGAVYVQYEASDATIVSSFFLTNSTTAGAGAVTLEGPGYVTATHFISNSAGGSGGALIADLNTGVGVQIDASRFQSNTTASSAGALSAFTAVITDTDFLGNRAGGDGGALKVTTGITVTGGRFAQNRGVNGGALNSEGNVFASGVRFEENSATSGGAGYVSLTGVFTDVDFISNTVTSGGGALFVWLRLDVDASRFVSNTALYGGAIQTTPSTTAGMIRNSDFTGNRGSQGGAIYNFGVMTITGSLLQGNAAESTGGAVQTDSAARTFISGTQILSNTAAAMGGGIFAYGPTTLSAVALQHNRCTAGNCADSNGLFAQRTVTVTADAPYTYTDNLNLRGDLVVLGNVTFTANVATFSVDYGVVTTHTLTGNATTTFHDLSVVRDAVLDVGGSVITATGVTTNAGVIHRLAPAQDITNGGPARIYDDGVGKPTAVLAQSGGADMGATTVRVSANLTTTDYLCNGRAISPLTARRYYVITPTNGAGVTADLTLYYFDGATNSESAGLDGADLRIFHCDGTRWMLLGQAEDYTTGTAGDYVWVKASDQAFTSFSPFAITAVPLTNTNLVNLQVFSSSVDIPLTPSFATATTSYTATVANDVVSVTVKPAMTQTYATVEVNGVEVISGSQSSPIPLAVGPNVITTVVYAQDGVTTQTYTVTVTRASAARLANLALSAGPLNPAPFISTTQTYTLATASFAAASTLVTATAEYAGDAIAVVAGRSGEPAVPCAGVATPWDCPLAVGVNVISVTITAGDNTARVYTVSVPRAGDASLSDLALSAAPINPAPFASTTLAYTTAALSNAGADTFVTPTLTYAASDVVTVTVAANGGAGVACSAAPYNCSLAVGENVISVSVTAIDNTTQVYTIAVPRASQAQLSGLTVAPGGVPAPLYPTFSAATQAYTMAVTGYSAITASVAITAAQPGDLVTVVAAPAGAAAESCTGAAPWTCPLAVGENTISTTVTAADNSTRVYTVTLTRAGDATLSTLEVSVGALNPTFISTTLAYTTSPVLKAVTGTLVTVTTTYASDSFTVTAARSGGAAGACSGSASSWNCPLLVGVNVVSVTVTAADTTTQVYTVTVERLPSDNADLASFDVRNVTIDPAFDPAATSYTASVPSYIARVAITPTAVDADATIAVSGSAVLSGTASPTIALGVGDSVITTVVTAENGIVTKSYVITMTRAAPVSPWYVQPDGDNTNPCTAFGPEYACQTIAGAMAKAVSGDTIYIAGATYTESLTVGKSLTFIGVNTPTVSGGGVSRVFTITAGADVTLDGLIVSGGWLSSTVDAAGSGAGIYNAGHLTVTNSTVTGSAAVARYGGAIYQTGVTATLQLLDSALLGNTAQQGGGLYVANGAATLTNSLVSSNLVTNSVTARGGGIYVDGAGTVVTVTNSTVGSNTARNDGGGLFINNGTLRLVNSTLSANRASTFGGGLYIEAGASHVITNSVVASNIANMGAGLATRAPAPLTLYAMTIYSNTAINGGGGGVYANPALTIVGGAIYSNTSNSNGAGVYAGSALTMTSVTVAGNANSLSSYGAGVFVYGGAATISGSRFVNNSCTGGCNGAGLYTYDPVARLTLVDTQFISNVATNLGGGLYAVGPVALSGGEFRGNRTNSSPAGSGLYAERVVTITASVPYTYVDGFDLRGDLTVSDAFTFTAGAVNFVVDPYNPTTIVTHTLNGSATTSFNDLAVVDSSVLDVGSSVVRVSGIFTNAGVINRLAPTQTIDALNTPYTFDDGVGAASAVITQTGGAAMNDTTVWVSAHLPAGEIACGSAQLPYGAVRRIFAITPANGAGVTADLTLSYYDDALNSERGALDPANLVLYRCNGGVWQSPDATYVTGADGAYAWVTMSGYTFDSFGLFAIGAPPSRNADLIDLVLQGAAVTPTLTPAFEAAVFTYTTTVASDVFTVTAQPTVSDTTAVVRVNGVVVASGERSGPIDLAVGTTAITTVVTAQDGLTTQTYTITVTRPPECMATPDNGATEFISFDGSAVQQAMDVASPDATVKVAGACRGVQPREGETQTLYISQTLTIEGGYSFIDWTASYPITQPTTLDAEAGGRVIFATAPVTVANLTIQNGAITGSDAVCPGAGCGGGVYAGAILRLNNVQVVSNTAVHGGGVHGNTTVTVAGGRFENNMASGDGGGLRAAGTASVADTTFVSNTASNAGGALLEGESTVANTSFVGNATGGAGSAGGGYFNGIAALTNVTFTNNTAGAAGGGGAVFAAAATVTGGEFVSNTAPFAGGGAYFNDAATLTGTRIAGNTATANRGGGAYFNGTAVLSNTVLSGNAATSDRGGGAYFRGPAELVATSFVSNTASNRAGGAYFFGAATLTDTNFIGNVGTVRAGGAWVSGAAVVSGGLFQDNRCTSTCLGGGLFVSDTLTMTGAQFIGNVTDGSGGGLLTQGNADVANTTFVGNVAANGGGGWGQAGGTTARSANSLFAGNSTASGLGDAIAVLMADNSGRVTVLHTTIASPTVSAGAAIYVGAGTVDITNTIVASHTAGIQNAGGVVVSDYNLFFAAPTTIVTGSHSIDGRDPRFVDSANGDYQLAAGSAAIDTGVDVGVAIDLNGALRPQGDGYDIGAYESPLSSNADLASLVLSQGTLTPPFDPTTTQYTVTAAYDIASVTFTPATVEPGATISVNEAAVLSGTASAPIALAVGENAITTTVTASNGVKTRSYTVVVVRASLAALTGLEIDPGTLTPAFISTTLAYTAQVTNLAGAISVTPTASSGDVITVTVSQNGGAPIACSGAETACPLVVGANVLTITVTAADGTTQSYTITVARPSDATLIALELNPGVLEPSFISTTLAYTAAVGNPDAGTHVTATANPGDVIGVAVTPEGGAPSACTGVPVTCPLAVGANVIDVTVTALDSVARTYSVTVTRAPATDDALIALEISTGTLTPAFAPETTAYAATVANVVASLTVTPTASEPNATITVNGAPVGSGTGSAPITLIVGGNLITTTVTAQDGVTVRTYVIFVTRPAIGVLAVNDVAGMLQGGVAVVAPLANDEDPVGGGLTVAGVGQPAHGVAVIDAGAQTVTYTPDPAFSGVDWFTCVASDANGSTDESVVAVIVGAQSQTSEAPQIGLIDNQNGSMLNFADYGYQVSVQAPAGSYSGAMGPQDIFYLVYTVISTPTGDVNQAPHGLRFGNIVFDLSAYFNYDLLPGYRFPAPVTLELTYDPAMLDGLSEATLELFYWDGAAWSSDGITLLARDAVNHRITISLAHLSELAVFGSVPTALEPGDEPDLSANRLYLPVVARESGTVVELSAQAPSAAIDAPGGETFVQEDAPDPTPAPDDSQTPAAPEEVQLPMQNLLPIVAR